MRKKVYDLNLLILFLIGTIFLLAISIYGPYDLYQRDVINQIEDPMEKINAFFEYERTKAMVLALWSQFINNIILIWALIYSFLVLKHLNHRHKLKKIVYLYSVLMVMMNLGHLYLISNESMWLPIYNSLSGIIFASGIFMYKSYNQSSS